MARNKYDIDEKLESVFDIKYLKRLLRYVKPYTKSVVITILLMQAASISALLGPFLVKNAIDSEIPHKDIPGLFLLSGIYLATLVFNAICLKFRIRNMSCIGQSIIHNIRKDIFDHLQLLPFSYYDSRPHGKILVRVVNYVNSLSDLLSNGLVNLITDMFTLVAIVLFMFFINARLTFICLTGMPLLMAAVFLIKNAQRKGWQQISTKQSNMNAYIHESICGMKVTQSYTREKENQNIFRNLCNQYKSAWMSTMKVQLTLWPMIDTISILCFIAVFITGINLSNAGVTVGVLVAFSSYIWRFWEPITNLSNFYNNIITAMAYLERIFETIDEKPLVSNLPGAKEMPCIRGGIEFGNVSFSYEEGEKILDDVSFQVCEGETIALVGPTGAGKTTIVNLISRFYEVEKGKILIDGIDIKHVTLESLRSQMGIMLQDTFIFSGTIMDNIRYSRLDASDEEVIRAAKAVKAHDFISGLKDGYNTEVNERGSRLSVGQRQLISFARALLANPRILILDEATSSIDTQTEMALQEGLERLLKGRTSFIIAHRLSTIRNASRIMYIDNGKIAERGNHEQLMAQKGLYWKLYTAQYRLLDAV